MPGLHKGEEELHHSFDSGGCTHELVRRFSTFDDSRAAIIAASEKRHREHRQQGAAVHASSVALLQGLRQLETELNLTFKAVQGLSPAGAGPDAGTADVVEDEGDEGGDDCAGEEIAVQLELQGGLSGSAGRGKAKRSHALCLRSPWAWELHSQAATGPCPTPRATPATTPRPMSGNPVLGLRGGGAAPVGDSKHAICLSLHERAPEMITLRRVRAVPSRSAKVAKAELHSGAADWIASVEAQCGRLEKSFGQKLAAHCGERRGAPTPGAEALPRLPGSSGVPPPTHHSMGEGDAAAAAALGHAQGYLRDVRSALRLLGPRLPSAARLLEGAIKGAVLALDTSVTQAQQQAAGLLAEIGKVDATNLEMEDLKKDIHALKEQNATLQEQLANTKKQYQAEMRAIRERNEELKSEILRLSPEQDKVEGVAKLMGDYNMLMHEMEDESDRRSQILRDMTQYTTGIIRGCTKEGEDPEKLRSKQTGRVVELPTGEIVLRPHEVAEEGTQVTERDLLRVDTEAPVRFRGQKVRQLFAEFQGRDVPEVTQVELNKEIDQIYSQKIHADAEADAAGLPRRELLDFVAEFYLDELGSVQRAEQKLCGILECLRGLEQSPVSAPLKVSLFARFLQFCNLDSALQLPVLSMALHAKRVVTASLRRSLDITNPIANRNLFVTKHRESAVGNSLTKDALAAAETKIPVGIAYDAAVAALPTNCIAAHRELFATLSRHSECESSRSMGNVRELNVLLLIVHEHLQREAAPQMRELANRAKQRTAITAEEFREALVDAQILGIDDAIWRPRLCGNALSGLGSGQLSGDILLDFLGGGAQSRLPRAVVSESALMAAVVEAAVADYADRLGHLKRTWNQNSKDTRGVLSYEDFKFVVQFAEPSLPSPMVRALFLESVEASRACSQFENDACPLLGASETVESGLYGGEAVMFRHFWTAAMQCRLFVRDTQLGERPPVGVQSSIQLPSGGGTGTAPRSAGNGGGARSLRYAVFENRPGPAAGGKGIGATITISEEGSGKRSKVSAAKRAASTRTA